LKKSKKEERIIFLEGRKVILRPLDKETDLDKCLRWVNDPEVIQYVSAVFPRAKKQEEEWFDKEKENEVRLAIETKEKEEFIGSISLFGINNMNRVAELGIMIGEKTFWSNGYGTDAAMILIAYGFNSLNLRKIKWSALDFNERSVNCSKRCGCKVEGILKKEIFTNGEYVDMVCLAVFKKDFLPLWEKYQNGSRL